MGLVPGNRNIIVTSSALPDGGSSAVNQVAANALLTTIEGNQGNLSTAANQTAANAILSAIQDLLNIDGVTNALRTIDYPHHEIHAGSYYYIKGQQDIDGAGTNLDFLWSIPDTTTWVHSQWNLAGEAEFTFSLYEDVETSNDGTAITIRNANRNSDDGTGAVTAFTGPTLRSGALGDEADGGLLVWQGIVGSGKNSTTGRSTGYEFIGRRNTKYWFRATKAAANAHWFDYDFNWYEHTNI